MKELLKELGKRVGVCDRCGRVFEIDPNIHNHQEYKNAILCLECVKIRNFDDNNPILFS